MSKDITFEITKKKIGYMMATKAFHLLGDISSDEPDLCNIYSESNGYYVGVWATGYGFIDVLFPKRTTRPLTDDEIDYWSGKAVQIANQPPHRFNADDLRSSREAVESVAT